MPKAATTFWTQGMFLFILGVSSFTLQIFTLFYSLRIQEWCVLQTSYIILDSAVNSEEPLKNSINNLFERGNRCNLNVLQELFCYNSHVLIPGIYKHFIVKYTFQTYIWKARLSIAKQGVNQHQTWRKTFLSNHIICKFTGGSPGLIGHLLLLGSVSLQLIHLAPFFFLVGDFSDPADPGCCDFFGWASRFVIYWVNVYWSITSKLSFDRR